MRAEPEDRHRRPGEARDGLEALEELVGDAGDVLALRPVVALQEPPVVQARTCARVGGRHRDCEEDGEPDVHGSGREALRRCHLVVQGSARGVAFAPAAPELGGADNQDEDEDAVRVPEGEGD
jgi:hypothetical protein